MRCWFRRGRKALLSVFTVSALAAAILLGSPTALATTTRAPAKMGVYPFDCTIPDFGDTQCGNNHGVDAGEDVEVDLNHSGGKEVTFQAYNTNGDHLLGTVHVYPGDPIRRIWHNNTGHHVTVGIFASSSAVVRVRAQGNYLIG